MTYYVLDKQRGRELVYTVPSLADLVGALVSRFNLSGTKILGLNGVTHLAADDGRLFRIVSPDERHGDDYNALCDVGGWQ